MTAFIASGVIFKFVSENHVVSTTYAYVLEDRETDHGSKNLMLGSSSLELLNQDELLKCGAWLNRGIGASRISSLSNYLMISPLVIDPAKILLYVGENDISWGMSADDALARLKEFIDELNTRYPKSEIHIIAIKPSPGRKEHLEQFATFNNSVNNYQQDVDGVYFHNHPEGENGFQHTSFAEDGVHLTEEGYKVFTAEFNKACKTS